MSDSVSVFGERPVGHAVQRDALMMVEVIQHRRCAPLRQVSRACADDRLVATNVESRNVAMRMATSMPSPTMSMMLSDNVRSTLRVGLSASSAGSSGMITVWPNTLGAVTLNVPLALPVLDFNVARAASFASSMVFA